VIVRADRGGGRLVIDRELLNGRGERLLARLAAEPVRAPLARAIERSSAATRIVVLGI
jgi:hypothetical protein